MKVFQSLNQALASLPTHLDGPLGIKIQIGETYYGYDIDSRGGDPMWALVVAFRPCSLGGGENA